MAETIQAHETRAEQLYAELEAKDVLRRQLLGRLTTAREEERRTIAREIHDELGQLLTGLSLNLKLCQQAMPRDPGEAADHLAKANALIGETIEESLRLIADLRPPVLDDFGLIPALQEELDQRLMPAGIAAGLDADGDVAGLPPEIATAAFRIAQEAVTNVICHANARQVDVRVQRTATALAMTIEDDGVGLPNETLGRAAGGRQAFGILGMQERAEALGGRLDVTRREPIGTRVTLCAAIGRRNRMNPIRVLLAEDHNVVREGLRLLLNAQPDIRVIGEATNGRQAVALARENCPEVAVLDISMPDLDGLQAARLIRAECPQTQVLILTMHESDAYFFRAVEAGAAGYLLKKAASEDLISAVHAVAQGEAFFYPSMARKLLEGYLKHDSKPPHPPAHPATTSSPTASAR